MSAELEALLAIGLLVLGVAAIVLVLGFLNRKDSGFYEKQKAEKARLQAHVDENMSASMQGKRETRNGWELSGQVDGVPFVYRLEAKAVGRVSATLTVATDAPGEFRVQPKGPGAAIARFFGMAREFRTGDRAIDRAYDFSATTDEYAQEVFGNAENLDLLRSLNAAGFHVVESTPSHLSANQISPAPLPMDAVRGAAACLARLRLPSSAPMGNLSRQIERLVLFAVPIGALFFISAGFWALDITRPLLSDFMIFMIGTSPIALIAWVAAFLLGRRYLRRHPMIAAPVMVWVLVLAPFLAVAQFGVLAYVNERFDGSEAQVHDLPQLSNYVVGARGHRAYRGFKVYKLDSWSGSGVVSIDTIGVPPYTGPSKDGQLWRLRVRAGLLGQPWIESAHPIKP